MIFSIFSLELIFPEDRSLWTDYNNYDATDDQGHGTACAGIAAAKGNNSSGIAGVCWDCLIMPVKVLDSGGYGDDTGISNGIEWAASNNADVISMSLGGGGYVSYTDSAINFSILFVN